MSKVARQPRNACTSRKPSKVAAVRRTAIASPEAPTQTQPSPDLAQQLECRISQVIGIAHDGSERVLIPAMPDNDAAAFARKWNMDAAKLKETAVTRDITDEIPSLADPDAGPGWSLIAVDMPSNWTPKDYMDEPAKLLNPRALESGVPLARAEGLLCGFNSRSLADNGTVWAVIRKDGQDVNHASTAAN